MMKIQILITCILLSEQLLRTVVASSRVRPRLFARETVTSSPLLHDNNDLPHKRRNNNCKNKIQRQRLSCAVSETICEAHHSKPFLLRQWIRLYQAIPKYYLPFTSLDISFTFTSAAFFTLLDYSSAFVVRKATTDWPLQQVRKLAGSVAAIFHASILVPSLYTCLCTARYSPSRRMDEHPVWWQDASSALIQFCTGYMIYDAGVQYIADRWEAGIGLVLSTTDWIFLGHHAATALYMTSTRIVRAGHMSAMMLMFLGEFTSPVMNLLRISSILASLDLASSWVDSLHPVIEYTFALLYIVFRALLGPFIGGHLTLDLLFTKKGRQNVPMQCSIIWVLLCWAVLIGSIPWIQNSMHMLSGRGKTVA